jgi:hypothetical protein
MDETSARKRALVVELAPYHGHLVYIQARMLLDAGYKVAVAVSELNRDIDALDPVRDDIQLILIPKSRLSLIPAILFWLKLNVWQYDLITFTTMSTAAMVLGLISRSRLQFLYHHPGLTKQDLAHSILWWFVKRRTNRFLVLSEHVFSFVKPSWDPSTRHKLAWFDPGYMQDYAVYNQPAHFNDSDLIRFVVPGQVTPPQRNYEPLIDSFPKIAQSAFKDRIQVVLLGNYFTPIGRTVIRRAFETNVIGSVLQLQHQKYSPFDEFMAGIRDSHFVIPLLDDKTTNVVDIKYNTEAIPTSILYAKAFAVPVIVSDQFDLDKDLEPFAIRFPDYDLFSGIEKAIQLVLSGKYADLRRRFKVHMEERYPLSLSNYTGEPISPELVSRKTQNIYFA